MSENRDPVPFESVDHTADWSLRVNGRDLVELFVHAAQGLASLLVAKPAAAEVERTLQLSAIDAESLLVEWLGELAYWAEAEGLVFSEIAISELRPTALTAVVRGGRVPELLKHIKAVTYHNLAITTTADGLTTTVVFDV